MEEHGLEVKDEQIYYGDFLRSKAYNAAMEWMPNPEKRPEAIICANDYMAITLCWHYLRWDLKSQRCCRFWM